MGTWFRGTFALSPTTAAYIAGLVDGEGTIGVTRYRERYRVHVQVRMTDRAMVEWLYEQFAYAVLNALLPYLRLKGPQARLALEYRTMRGRPGPGGGSPPEYHHRREELRLTLKRLNTRGVAHVGSE